MKQPLAILLTAALMAGATTWLGAQSAGAAACERLSSLALPGARVVSATPVPAGGFTPPAPPNAAAFAELPAFCRVTATAPRPGDTDVKIEVWLPAADRWSGEFQPAASGFAGGTIGYREMRTILTRGAATANTNRGHDGGGPWKPADMSAVPYHLMAENAKAIVAAYYGGPPRLTFMNECGGSGSRDALQLIQRAPADLDAAVAEGIIYRPTRHGVSQMWIYQATHASEASFIPPAKYRVLHQAALDACDAKDGLKDGIITDPPRCAFDPGVLSCKGGDAPDCLTPAQVTAARAIYSPPRDPRTGAALYPPLVPGGELNWQPIAGEAAPYAYAQVFYRNLVFQDPAWNVKDRPPNFTSDLDRGDAVAAAIDANDPKIDAFLAHGGKLLLIGGWNDDLPPGGNVEYYENIVKAVGAARAREGVRLFMVPGMHHCLGEQFATNPTTDFDAVSLLKQWKSTGRIPDRIVLTQTAGDGVATKRVVCAYPQVAQYRGKGSAEDPASFVCKSPG
jgi:feruloyl esterase